MRNRIIRFQDEIAGQRFGPQAETSEQQISHSKNTPVIVPPDPRSPTEWPPHTGRRDAASSRTPPLH